MRTVGCIGDLATRFWRKVNKNSGVFSFIRGELSECWLWTASTTSDGYGHIGMIDSNGKRTVKAHVLSHEWEYGELAEGLERDHLCRHRNCVRPDHIEAVTHEENMRRSRGKRVFNKTHCVNGHVYDVVFKRKSNRETLQRECLECRKESKRRYNQKKKDT